MHVVIWQTTSENCTKLRAARAARLKVKVKSLYLTSVVPSVARLVSMEADGAPFSPLPLSELRFTGIQCYGYTDQRKVETEVRSLKIEPRTSRPESCALANWAFDYFSSFNQSLLPLSSSLLKLPTITVSSGALCETVDCRQCLTPVVWRYLDEKIFPCAQLHALFNVFPSKKPFSFFFFGKTDISVRKPV